MAHNNQCEMEENSFYPLYMKELPEIFVKKAEVELGETPERREKSLTEMRKLILEEKDYVSRTDDEFLLIFLRPKKFNSERAFATLKTLSKLKMEIDFFRSLRNLDPLYSLLETKIVTLLPYRDPQGRIIVVFKASNWNPDEVTLYELFVLCIGLVYTALDLRMTQVNGVVGVLDLKDLSFKHLKQLTVEHIKLIIHALQEFLPLRLKAGHFLNESVIFKYLWIIIKPFLSKKLRNRLFFHGKNMESFHRYISSSILPFEYGGCLDTSDISEQIKEVQCRKNAFLDLLNSGYVKEEQKLRNAIKQ